MTMIAGLSDFLRRTLEERAEQQVPLEEELAFTQKYLSIQKVRFADSLSIEVNVPPELYQAQVPTLILQPIVENAIKHGIEKRARGGAIRITAANRNGMLHLKVHNDGPSIVPGALTGLGIGSANVQSRLRTLYGSAFTYEMENAAAGGVDVFGYVSVDKHFGCKSKPMSEAVKNAEPIRAFIVDDEPLGRNNIAILLRSHAEIVIAGECGSGREAVAEIRRLRPQIAFLDVQMPECDGFDVLELLGNDVPPAVIFVTAYDAHALKAFEVGAIDYLLKPFDRERFERMLVRVMHRLALPKSTPRVRQPFLIKSAGKVSIVRAEEIDWVEATDYYVSLHARGEAHLLRRSMAELEQELDASLFCRIHRSSIVRLDRVRRLELNEAGEYDVVLADGTTLRVSRRYRSVLQSRLDAGRANILARP